MAQTVTKYGHRGKAEVVRLEDGKVQLKSFEGKKRDGWKDDVVVDEDVIERWLNDDDLSIDQRQYAAREHNVAFRICMVIGCVLSILVLIATYKLMLYVPF